MLARPVRGSWGSVQYGGPGRFGKKTAEQMRDTVMVVAKRIKHEAAGNSGAARDESMCEISFDRASSVEAFRDRRINLGSRVRVEKHRQRQAGNRVADRAACDADTCVCPPHAVREKRIFEGVLNLFRVDIPTVRQRAIAREPPPIPIEYRKRPRAMLP